MLAFDNAPWDRSLTPSCPTFSHGAPTDGAAHGSIGRADIAAQTPIAVEPEGKVTMWMGTWAAHPGLQLRTAVAL